MCSGFPLPSDPGQTVDIPTYHPSTEQFMDPISYIASIQSDAEPYGMCRIVPPDEWKVGNVKGYHNGCHIKHRKLPLCNACRTCGASLFSANARNFFAKNLRALTFCQGTVVKLPDVCPVSVSVLKHNLNSS